MDVLKLTLFRFHLSYFLAISNYKEFACLKFDLLLFFLSLILVESFMRSSRNGREEVTVIIG